MVDKCFSQLKVFDEMSGDQLDTIHLNNLRDCHVLVDIYADGGNNIQFICINENERTVCVYDESGQLLAENTICEKVKNISEFRLTKDGYYIFIDYINDNIYFY
jgi:hypothetical protein